MRRIYVASSWRNDLQPGVVNWLRALGHEVYDFRNPRTGGPDHSRALERGFHWSEIDSRWREWRTDAYRAALLTSKLAAEGFAADWGAMNWADTGVLVLPAGASAHLEAGYFTGARGKELHILLPSEGHIEPELMYLMADHLHLDIWQSRTRAGGADRSCRLMAYAREVDRRCSATDCAKRATYEVFGARCFNPSVTTLNGAVVS